MVGEIGQTINRNDSVPVIDGRENDLMHGERVPKKDIDI
jgi:hypothetical protein